MLLFLPPPPLTCIARITAQVSHDYCAKYEPRLTPFCMPYTVQYW